MPKMKKKVKNQPTYSWLEIGGGAGLGTAMVVAVILFNSGIIQKEYEFGIFICLAFIGFIVGGIVGILLDAKSK